MLNDDSPPQAFWGNLSSVIPARIAYYLNLQGPAIAVDTACSSSLVAVYLACQGLWTGETEMALAGGVSIQCTPDLYRTEHRAGMLSPTGQCYTFDERANGFVPGEGVGVVVLKRLEDALADGDYIYGVIRGSAINQDGTTNGITAPSQRSQERLERFVYDQFGINPEEIQMVEAHGTGTKLGDPIEFQALTQAFRSYTDKKEYCAIGSIKTNIGHAQMAAGIAGLIKILLALKHKQIPPSLHFRKGNANISFKDSPFFVNTQLRDWKVEPGVKRRAAISSFGVSGTNAHMVIEEAPEVRRQHPDKPGYLLVLSARSEEELRKQAGQLIDHCKEEDKTDCGNMCYTLLVGRQHFKHRLACVVRDLDDAVEQLEQWLNRKSGSTVFSMETDGKHRELPALKKFGNHCIRACQDLDGDADYLENLATVAELYVQGYELDYEGLFADGQYSRVPLPTYPFARERYWVPEAKTAAPVPAETMVAAETEPAGNAEPEEEGYELMTFAEEWQAEDLPEGRVSTPAALVCFLSNPDYQEAVHAAVQARQPGTEVIFVAQGRSSGKQSRGQYRLNRDDGAAFRQVLDSLASDCGGDFALLYLWPLEDAGCIEDSAVLFRLLQAVGEAGRKPSRLLWAGAWRTSLERCCLESWIGWERSLGLILPQTRVAGILREAGPGPAVDMEAWLSLLWAELHTPSPQSVLYEGEQRYTCRIRPVSLGEERWRIQANGTYLITGGGGGLGRILAARLARSGPGNLILTGRSPLDARLQAELTLLEGTGSRVLYRQADVCDAVAMREVLREAKARFGGVNGVIHAAGLQSKEPLFTESEADFARVLAPKVKGTQVLDEVLSGEPLDFLLCFSSAAAILGDMGAGDYAVANRFLTAYARERNRQQRQGLRSGKTLVVHWPLWKEGGMGLGDDEQTHLYLKSSGQRALETEEGLDLLERVLEQEQTQLLVLAGQPDRVHRFLGLYREPEPQQPEPAAGLPAGKGRRPEMKGLSVRQCLEWDLRELSGQLLKIPREKLDLTSNLADFGFDSITLAAFAEQLTRHYGIELTPAVFFGYPTLGKLADYYLSEHKEALEAFYREAPPAPERKPAVDMPVRPAAEPEPSRRKQPVQEKARPSAVPEPIAVIGMSGRFPGARNIEEMWQHLLNGEDQVRAAGAERWPGSGAERWKFGAIPGVDEFDPLFFEISPREARSMDPRQRLLLQEAWNALEDAGYGPVQIKNRKIGMFVGVENGDYKYLTGFDAPITSNHDAILAARLSYVLNLNGPNLAVNTACSSGLVAVHLACQSLRSGDCDTAIAAGVNLILVPQTLEAIGQAGMLSPDGRCYAFDQRANGMVPGEAVAVVVLKPLSRAIADKDPIHAVIRGSGINYDGKTNGITAPSGVAQTQLYKEVYDQYGINPEDLEYIVAHGTGTRLGDPVEVNALRDAFQSYTDKENFCALTSTKTHFGHTFAASGLVSLISLVQAMRHETIPGSLHCEQENEYIRWKGSPFYVNKTNRPWKDKEGKRRLGAVSAFGMSGTNVHLVLESYPEERSAARHRLPYYLLALSAKTREALEAKISDMIAFLEKEEWREEDLLPLSYTLLNGRQHFRHRCAVVVQGREDAIYALKQAAGQEKMPHIVHGQVPNRFTGQKAIQTYVRDLLKQSVGLREDPVQYQETLLALAEFYCQGYEPEWELLFAGTDSHRLHLPTYPFARNTYWVPGKEHGTSSTEQGTPPVLTPMVLRDPVVHPEAPQPPKVSVPGKRTLPDMPAVIGNHQPKPKPGRIVLSPLTAEKTDSLAAGAEAAGESIEEELAAMLADVLVMDRAELDAETPFIELGMDSIVGVEWIQSVNRRYGVELTANIIYEYPDLRRFAVFLAQEMNGQEPAGLSAASLVPLPPELQPAAKTEETHPAVSLSSVSGEDVLEFLVSSLAESLSMDREEVDIDAELIDLGLDSIIGVEWIQAVNKRYGISLTANNIYEYSNLRRFAAYLKEKLSDAGKEAKQEPAGLNLEEFIRRVQAGDIDIEEAEQLLHRGGITK